MADTTADYVYYSTLDDSKVQEAMARIEARATKLAEKFETVFKTFDRAVRIDTRTFDIADQKLASLNIDNLLAQFSQLDSYVDRLNNLTLNINNSGGVTTTGGGIVEKSPITEKAPVDITIADATTAGIERLKAATVSLSPANDALSASIAQIREEIKLYNDLLDLNVGSVSENIHMIKELEAALNALEQEQQQLNAQNTSATPNAGVEDTDAAYKRLLADELKLINTGDQLTQSFIEQADAASQYAFSFIDLVSVSDEITTKQINVAKAIARAKIELDKAIKTNQSATDPTVYAESSQRINELIGILKALESEQEAASLTNERTAISQQKSNAEMERAKRIFIANANAVGGFRTMLANLINAQGTFTLKLNATDAELDENQRKVLRAIQENSQLAAVYKTLSKNVGGASIQLDQLDFPVDKVEKASKGIGKLGEAIKYKLINYLEQGVRAAVNFFRTLSDEAVKTAEEFKVTQIAFEQILGDPQAALATFNLIRRESERAGADITGLVAQLLPSLADPAVQIPQLATIAQGLSRTQAAILQGRDATDATIALTELFAGGQTKSLKERYNFDPVVLREVLELIRTEGQAAGADRLIEYLGELGLLGEDLTNTYTQTIARLKSFYTTLKGEIGTPINDALLVFFQQLSEFIAENRDDILALGFALGEALTTLLQFASTNILDNLNTDTLTSAYNSLLDFINLLTRLSVMTQGGIFNLQDFNLVEAIVNYIIDDVEDFIVLLSRIFGFKYDDSALAKAFEKIREYVTGVFDEYGSAEKLLQTGQQLVAIIKYLFGAVVSAASVMVKAIKDVNSFLADPFGNKDIFDDYGTQVLDQFFDTMSSYEDDILATASSISEQNAAIRENTAELEDNIAARKEARNVTEPINAAPTATIDEGPSEDELEAAEDVLRKRLELEKKYIEAELDLEIEVERKRADIWEDYWRDIKDADRDFWRDLEDAELDYNRSVEDLTTELAEKREDIDQESADKALEIQREYLRKLEDLRRKFQFDAQEAIRENDAIRFLQLRRQLEYDRRTARIDRDRALEDQSITEDQKLEELKTYEERKRAELRLEYERELEDIRIKDARKRQDAIVAREQELADLITYEERKRADLLTEYERELAEFNVFQKEKEDGTAAALAELDRIVRDGNQALADTESELYRTRIANFERFVNTYKRTAAGLQTLQDSNLVEDGTTTGGETTADQNRLRQLRIQAERIARSKNLLTDELMQTIANAKTITALQRIINDLIMQPIATTQNVEARATGGPVKPNRSYLVGEAGPELLTMGSFGGYVTPMMDANNFRVNLPNPTPVSNNNEFKFVNSIQMLDPNTLSPGQIAIIQQVITQFMMGMVNQL